ncbi:hypothetical protein HY612_01875, partial [Candidatus Roizmanbacteria bacterium]|nr:hypothetical protein [Candidatus Roizmanbacteria bacterium]
HSQSFNVGLSVSPHIIDIRERCQINNRFITEDEFTQTFLEIIPAVEETNKSKYGRASYFDILIAFAFYLFWKKRVDFAVIETGLGGLYDSTNIVKNSKKIAVITKIGLDHQWYLGNTYSKVAFQKAGIIQKRNNVVTIDQKQSVIDVFNQRVQEKRAKLYLVKHGVNIQNIKIDQNKTQFDFQFQNLELPKIKLGLIGYHQAENAGEALTSLSIASNLYHFKIKKGQIYKSLRTAFVPGRFEIILANKRDIIIDGAHNQQKMKTFLKSLIAIYPNIKFNFLISFSSGKDQITTMEEMLKKIISYAKHIYLTEFTLVKQDNNHKAVAYARIQHVLAKLHFTNYTHIKDSASFLHKYAKREGNPLVITGSLYLISSLYQNIQKLKMS